MDTHILGTQTVETDLNTSEERPALPLPQDLKTLLLLGTFLLLFLYARYFFGRVDRPNHFRFYAEYGASACSGFPYAPSHP
jgi:hypothetical protein